MQYMEILADTLLKSGSSCWQAALSCHELKKFIFQVPRFIFQFFSGLTWQCLAPPCLQLRYQFQPSWFDSDSDKAHSDSDTEKYHDMFRKLRRKL